MPLPRIANSAPVVVPPKAEKTFPEVYVQRINIESREGPSGRKISVSVNYVPFNYDTGEMSKDKAKQITINDVETAAILRTVDGKPALGEAMTAIITAVSEIISEQ